MAKSAPLNLEQYGDSLPGEVRSFGGNGFYVDLIPSSAWFANLRAMMPLSQWKALSAYVRRRHHDCCEMCGSDKRLEAHERWSFDEKTQVQKLMRIMCLCKMCHLSVHIGVASQLGFREEVENHIFSMTGWGKNDLAKHLADSRDAWKALSRISWKQDVSIVQNAGLKMHDPDTLRSNIAVKHTALDEERTRSSIQMDEGIGELDLSREIREGYVAILWQNDADRLGGVPLSDALPYIAKHPSEVGEDANQIPLLTFIKAHNKPVTIRGKEHLDEVLKEAPGTARRLIVKSSWANDELIAECFKRAILFSFE
ncbi:MAG: hypothetical protein ACYCSN_19910 [Acidobacteriaceae bacterium]